MQSETAMNGLNSADFYVPITMESSFNNLNNISFYLNILRSKLQKSESSKVDSRNQGGEGEEYGTNQTISEKRSNIHITQYVFFLAALKFIYF